MKWVGIAFLLVALAVLETVLGGPWLRGHVVLDLTTTVIVYVALLSGRRSGAVAGFLAGFLADLTGPGVLGRTSLVLAAVGFLTGLVGSRVVRESGLAQFLFIALAVCVRQIAALAASSPAWGEGVGVFFAYVLPSALASAGLGLWLFRVFTRLTGMSLRVGGLRVR